MKQNIYDDPTFFDSYIQLRRNESGLNKVLEEPAMRSLLPDINGSTILDIGCGFGKNCKFYAEAGANKVVGIDISSKMIALAKETHAGDAIEYLNVAVEDANFEKDIFDLVTSSLTLHYIENYRQVVSGIASILKPGGKFIFSVEHPIATALPEQQWKLDAETNRKYWPVDNYAYEGPRKTNWFIDNVIKYHRTVSTYVNVLLEHQFLIEHLGEPTPSTEFIKQRPNLELFQRRPAFLVISARKG